MKRIALAIVLGLAAGWGFSRLIAPPPPEELSQHEDSAVPAPLRNPSPGRLGPPPPRGFTGSTLDEQRASHRKGRNVSPVREAIFSMDLVNSLTTGELAEAIRSGQIRNETELTAAIGRIARTDAKLAVNLLGGIIDRSTHGRVKKAIVEAAVETDPAGFLDLLESMPRTQNRAFLGSDFATVWVDRDPDAAMAVLERLEGVVVPFYTPVADSMLAHWAAKDYEAVEKWVNEKADPGRRAPMIEALAVGHVEKLELPEAIDFILERPENKALQRKLTDLLRQWSMADPQAAIARLVDFPDVRKGGRDAEVIGSGVAMSLSLRNREDMAKVLDWKDKIPAGPKRRQFLQGAANVASSNHIPSAVKIIEAIPESRERESALGMLTELWMRADPAATSAWLATLEPSASRDYAVSRFATLIAKSDPERARQWAGTIADEKERKRVMGKVAGAGGE